MLNFQKSTFICLDLPEKMAEKIRKIRMKLDSQISWKPVVITIAGSSGVGHISDEQDIFEANRILTDFTKKVSPIKLNFTEISSFPETDIYFFEFEDESKLVQLHDMIKSCGIKFFKNEYPFKAHCTIHFKGKMDKLKKEQILNIEIPMEEFEINSLSLISDYNHLSRFQLKGNQSYQLKGG